MSDSGARVDLAHIARLSRLVLTEDEARSMEGHMEKILAWVDELNELDTAGVDPDLHAGELPPVLRPDEPRLSLPVDEALRNAPAREDGGFAVPAVLSE